MSDEQKQATQRHKQRSTQWSRLKWQGLKSMFYEVQLFKFMQGFMNGSTHKMMEKVVVCWIFYSRTAAEFNSVASDELSGGSILGEL